MGTRRPRHRRLLGSGGLSLSGRRPPVRSGELRWLAGEGGGRFPRVNLPAAPLKHGGPDMRRELYYAERLVGGVLLVLDISLGLIFHYLCDDDFKRE